MNSNTWYGQIIDNSGHILLAMILFGGIATYAVSEINKESERKEKVELVASRFTKNAAGHFAVNSFKDCMGSRFSGKTKNECANEVIVMAENMKGEPFGKDVARVLDDYLAALDAAVSR